MTYRYTPPEFFENWSEDITKSLMNDIWPLACIIYELITGRLVYYKITENQGKNPMQKQVEVVHLLQDGNNSSPLTHSDGDVLQRIPPLLMEKLTACFSYEHKKRPTAADLYLFFSSQLQI